ncbi:MAG: Holliday junction branch migration protein RuvA [Candidatus Latescibacterota bacterium]|nr:MAG: Holliday junction branch migration protein RuvA [Candidatus Latescibacterota bacterium]
MIAYVEGSLSEKAIGRAIVDVGGVGYDLAISLSTYEDLPRAGTRVRLLTLPYMREDSMRLFGFSTEGERELFRLLLGVPGIGPKLALSVLSAMRPPAFRSAIAAGDLAGLSRVPGIGKKSAERLVVELRGKVGGDETGAEGVRVQTEGTAGEARRALETLGFRTDQASRAVAKALSLRKGEEPTVEDLVREALAHA